MAIDTSLPVLPPPLALPADISFRRLLQSCERLAGQVSHSRSQGDEQQSFKPEVVKLRMYVDSLYEALADLERSCAMDLDQDTLKAYKQHVRALAAKSPSLEAVLPAYCKKPVAAPAKPLPAVSTSGRGGGSGRTGSGSLDKGSRGSFEGGISDATKDRLRDHEQIQEDLTDDLVGMASQLKAGSMGLQEAVKKRGKLVDETETHLTNSAANAKEVAAKAKEQYKRSSGTFCLTLGVLLLVGLVFALMVVYIKFSYIFLGYRSSTAAGGRGSTGRYGDVDGGGRTWGDWLGGFFGGSEADNDGWGDDGAEL